MITKGLNEALDHIIEDLYLEIQPNDNPANTVMADRKRELIALIRAEAINLADKLIGKDRVIHSTVDLKEGTDILDREDKAVYDYQVQQRIALAKYQNPMNGPTGPEELLNDELSENEA